METSVEFVAGVIVVQKRFFFAACSLFLLGSLYAQTCATEKNSPRTIKLAMGNVIFENAAFLSAQEQEQITKKLREERIAGSSVGEDFSGLADEAAERVRAAYQNEGYFKVRVTAKAVTITKGIDAQHDIVVQVLDAGPQYWLRDIHYRNVSVFSEQRLLEVMPIHPGEIFSREKVAAGLEALRSLYGSQGYINFTSVPNTEYDEENSAIALDIDVDEGREFKMGRFDVVGSDPETKAKLLQAWELKAGDTFRPNQVMTFVQKVWALGLDLPASSVDRKLDERNGIVDIVADFRKTKNCSQQGN